MAITSHNVKAILKECGSGRGYLQELRNKLGIKRDPVTAREYVDDKAAQIHPSEFSVRELAEGFMGTEFVRELNRGMSSSTIQHLSKAQQERELFEDAVGVAPSVFQDINAFTATVSGLVERRILDGYNSPQFIGNEFVTIEPTISNGGKVIGVPYPNPASIKLRVPDQEFGSIGLNQLWVWAKENMEVGGKLALDRNTVVYDLTGELFNNGERLGLSLGWVKEVVIAGGVMGLSSLNTAMVDQSIASQIGNSFRMNQTLDSTPNPTYQTVGVTTNPNLPNAYNYVNSQAQTFTDWSSLAAAQALLNLMRDPVNNLPFQTRIAKVLVDPSVAQLAQYVKRQTQVTNVTGTPATAGPPAPSQGSNSTVPPMFSQAPASLIEEINGWQPYYSNIWHQLWLDAGVTEANAKKRWIAGDPQKAFKWRSAWDNLVQQANPSSSEMLSKNIISMWVGQWSGQFVVVEPRYVVLNTE